MLDRRKQFISLAGMTPGDLPFTVIEGTRLVKDFFGNHQFANIVQIGTAAQIVQVFFVHMQRTRQLDGPLGDSLGMLLVLPPAYDERPRPALNGGIIRHGQFEIGPLEVMEEGRAVNGEGGLPGQRGEKFEPVIGGFQNRAM